MEEKKEPYIDPRYYCASCGSHSHKCEPENGRCYECGADDWEVEPCMEFDVY